MANAVLGISLAVNSTAFARGMKQAQGDLSGFVKAATSAKSMLVGALGAVGVGLSVAKLAGDFKATANAMEEVGDSAAALGIATKSLSGLKYAADVTGTSFSAVTGGLTRMNRAIFEATSGSESAARGFQLLGLDAQRIAGLAIDQQFNAIAEGVANTGNAAQRTAAIMAIFGRGGMELAEILQLGASGLAEMNAEGEKFNAIFDAGAADAANDMNESLRKMGQIWQGVVIVAVEKFAPLVEGAADTFAEWATQGEGLAEKIGGWFDVGINKAAELESGLREILKTFESINGVFGAIGRAVDIVQGVGEAAAGAVLGAGGIAVGAVTGNKDNVLMRAGTALTEAAIANAKDVMSSAEEEAARHQKKVEAGVASPRAPRANPASYLKEWQARGEANAAAANAAEAARANTPGIDLEAMEAEADRIEEMEKAAAKITEQFRTPQEVFADRQKELNAMLEAGAISWETYARAMEDAGKQLADSADGMKDLRNEAVKLAGVAGSGEFSKIAFRGITDGSSGGGMGGGDFGHWAVDPLQTPIGGWNKVAWADALRGYHGAGGGFFARADAEMRGNATQSSGGATVRDPQLAETNTILQRIENALATRQMVAVAA